MPYKVIKKGSKYQTVTETTGKVHGTFNSKEQAEKQLKALYANSGAEAKPKKKVK